MKHDALATGTTSHTHVHGYFTKWYATPRGANRCERHHRMEQTSIMTENQRHNKPLNNTQQQDMT